MSLHKFHNKLKKIDLITVDLGNGHPHIALFKKGELKEVFPFSEERFNKLYHEEIPLRISSVRKDYHSSFSSLIKEDNFCGMPLHYEKTLGHDRLLASFLLYHVFNTDFLLVDAGTFLTIDLGSKQGHLGGYIFPGLHTFSQSYQRGDQLQIPIKIPQTTQRGIPQTTAQAIEGAIALYRDGLVSEIKKLSRDRHLILTGGELKYFKDEFSQALSEPHLLHYALYFQYVYEILRL